MRPHSRSGPFQGVEATLAFSTVSHISMVPLHGRIGRLTAQNGVSRPGQDLFEVFENEIAKLQKEVAELNAANLGLE